MNRKSLIAISICASASILLGTLPAVPARAETKASYLYHLSDFSGTVESLWARVSVDPQQGEVYTLNRSDSAIQIFSDTAMQVFGYGENLALASAQDITSGDAGDVYLLSSSPVPVVKHLNYRGEQIGSLLISNLGLDIAFQPDYIDYRAGNLFLADAQRMRVLVLNNRNEIVTDRDLRQEIAAQIRSTAEGKNLNAARMKKVKDDLTSLKGAILNGFSADSRNTIYFTVAPLFTAFRATADGGLDAFGIPGGAPGKFGVIAGIAADSEGKIFVSDRLRCVVLIFDPQLNFLTEFGYRGEGPANLTVPDDIAIDDQSGRIYVAQAANLGVSVFSINND